MMQKTHTILIFLIILVQAIYALDPMYEYRYTLGPEILVPDALHVGAGAYTRFNESGKGVINLQIGLSENFETGFKVLAGTTDDWVISNSRDRWVDGWPDWLLDVGAKFAITPHTTIQADVPIPLWKHGDFGGVLTVAHWDGYTKNLSFLYEGRLGFFGAAGEDTYVKPAAAIVPNFQIGESFRASIGLISSCSFEHFKDDFMFDIMPKVEAGLKWFRLMGEVSIGTITYKAQRHNRYALFIVSDV